MFFRYVQRGIKCPFRVEHIPFFLFGDTKPWPVDDRDRGQGCAVRHACGHLRGESECVQHVLNCNGHGQRNCDGVTLSCGQRFHKCELCLAKTSYTCKMNDLAQS